MAQVGALYRGEIKNWKALGGPEAVSLYGRQSNSGTYIFMQEHVLGNKNYSPDMKEMNGNAQIIEGVLQDEGGVGYVGVGYLFDKDGKIRKGLKVLNISKTAERRGFLADRQGRRRLRRIPHRQAALHGHQRKAEGPCRRLPGLDQRARRDRPSSNARGSSPSARPTRPRTTRT